MKTQTQMKYWQQGDQLLKETKIPRFAKKMTTLVIQESQVTGHKHEAVGAVQQLEKDGLRYLRAVEPFKLTHQEHNTIELPAGDYAISTVMEYDHLTEEARQVAD